MDYADAKPEDIPKKLVEKHKKLLSESKTALQNIDRIKILEEKLDQINHWIEESKGKKKEEYLKRKEAAEAELAKLRGDSSSTKVSAREFEQRIAEHERALEYWKTQ
jgi:hypothetical protein